MKQVKILKNNIMSSYDTCHDHSSLYSPITANFSAEQIQRKHKVFRAS